MRWYLSHEIPRGMALLSPPAKVWLLAANHISVLGQLHCSTANLLHFQPPWPLFYNMWIQIHWLDPGPEFWLNLDPDLVSWVSRWWIYVYNLTSLSYNYSYIYLLSWSGSVFGIRIQIHKGPEYGPWSSKLHMLIHFLRSTTQMTFKQGLRV